MMLVCLSSIQAQPRPKTKVVEGSYTYYAPNNVTVQQAENTALERAKIQAIADAFGTIISQNSTIQVKNNQGQSNLDFTSISGCDVKGEWLETLREPVVTKLFEEDKLIVTAKVKGRAREIVSAGVDFQAKVLRNDIDDKYEAEEFMNGDDLYLSFMTPISGYLAVYLLDETRQAYCLLPYRNQKEGVFPVKANKRYVFFKSTMASENESPYIDEYVLTCQGDVESNLIYVIFSPNHFVKAIDNESTRNTDLEGTMGLPRELTYKDFQRWLTKQRKHDINMSVRMFPITIKKE